MAYVCRMVKDEKGKDTARLDRSASKDDVLRHVTYLMFHHLRSLISNRRLYSEGKEWSDLAQYVQEHCQLRALFRNMLDSVLTVLKGTRPPFPRPSVIELDEYGVPVNQPTL